MQIVYVEGREINARQVSDHAKRRDTRMNDSLEQWLEDWGAWDAKLISELCTPCKTSLKVAEEMRPERLKATVDPIEGLPMWLSRLVYDLQNMWKKTNFETTRKIRGRVPTYRSHYRMSQINKAVNHLHEVNPVLWSIVVMRYKLNYDWQRAHKEIGLSKDSYFRRLKDAKKIVRQYLQSCE